jgi:hypothetical protein
MKISSIKSFINRLINSKQDTPLVLNDSACSEQDYAAFNDKLRDITANPDIDTDMKIYADRLVKIYLPAILSSYNASKDNSDEIAQRLNRTVDNVKNEIFSYIEGCLTDIECGAIFKDNLADIFLTSMVEFEQRLESRQAC